MISIYGCGALGSRIAHELVGHQLWLVDDDTVGEENIAASVYARHHIGVPKARALADICARRGIDALYVVRTLQDRPTDDADVIIDCFDNYESRRLLAGPNVLHVGVGQDLTGSCIWDEWYEVSDEGRARGENPVCTHQLGQAIILMTAAAAVQVVRLYMGGWRKANAFTTETSVRIL